MQLIYDEAEALAAKSDDDVELESKVILSIGIRLRAEEFMIAKINDPAFVNAISSNQTFELYSRFSLVFPGASEQLMVLSQVNLMTPENIHLNSFMYEPILDMSALHLYECNCKSRTAVSESANRISNACSSLSLRPITPDSPPGAAPGLAW